MSNEGASPEAYMIATLQDILAAQKQTTTQLQQTTSQLNSIDNRINSTNTQLATMLNLQEKSTVHIKYDIDLTIARKNVEIADYTKTYVDVDDILVLPVPSPISLKLRGLQDESIDLNIGDSYSISDHVITRMLITNAAGKGIAHIHIYGKSKLITL